MKNFRTFAQITMLAGLCIAFNQVNASDVSANKIRTEAVKYNNNLIPSVHLKEVQITGQKIATPSKGALCQLKQVGNKLVASVEMNEVTIKASGIYTPQDNVSAGIVAPSDKGMLVEAIKVNGKYIPHITTEVVEIVANKIDNNQQAISENTSANETPLRISVRRAFDRLATFAFEQTKNIVRKTVPAWLGQ